MRRFILCFLIMLLLCGSAAASEEEEALSEALPSEASELLGDISVTDGTGLWDGLRALLARAIDKSGATVTESLRLCAVLLGVMLLCSLVKMSSVSGIAVACVGALGLCAACVSAFHSMIGLATDTVREMTDYNACLLPVLSSALAMQGGVNSAAALSAGTVLFTQLLMQLVSKLLVPLTYFYLAIATAEAALDSDMLSELREFVGWVISKSLRILLYIFLAFLSLTGVIGGAADATAVKATKAAVSGMVPVVGGILADASETLLASATLLRNSVGVFGMLAVFAICLIPFLRVGIHYLMLKVTAAISGTVGLKAHVGLMKHFTAAMGFLLAMCGSCALMSLLSVVCFLRVVI